MKLTIQKIENLRNFNVLILVISDNYIKFVNLEKKLHSLIYNKPFTDSKSNMLDVGFLLIYNFIAAVLQTLTASLSFIAKI